MRKQTFTIPQRLPGLNEVIAANRNSPYKGANLKRKTENDIMLYIRQARLETVEDPCIVCMVFDEPNRRRDVDNVESAKKFVLDALVKAGILHGDGQKWVIGAPSFTRYADTGAMVKVTIIENADAGKLREQLRQSEKMILEGLK